PDSAPELGPDGILSAVTLADAGNHAAGIFATSPGADADHQPSATAVLAAYRQAYPDSAQYNIYTMAAYDAANIAITAIDKLLRRDGDIPDRGDVTGQIAHTHDFPGVLGPIGFDANGDTTHPIVTIFGSQGN